VNEDVVPQLADADEVSTAPMAHTEPPA
jgi:hypothetical protein